MPARAGVAGKNIRGSADSIGAEASLEGEEAGLVKRREKGCLKTRGIRGPP